MTLTRQELERQRHALALALLANAAARFHAALDRLDQHAAVVPSERLELARKTWRNQR